jgi:hypothetical protein
MNLLPELKSGQLVLVVGPHAAEEVMVDLAAALARRGRLRVLDGGLRFNAYRLARSIRRRTEDLDAALGRISLARAFTCYQMEALLAASANEPVPTLALDLLATFFDENERLAERQRLLHKAINHLQRLSQSAPVAVSVQPTLASQIERTSLLDMLRESASLTWEVDMPTAPELPPRLFY